MMVNTMDAIRAHWSVENGFHWTLVLQQQIGR
jgi:predicted transposase YbfD/YdcC